MWDTENAKSFEPLIALQMGDEPIVAFDFQVLGESHNMSGDNICVIAVTKELSLRVSYYLIFMYEKEMQKKGGELDFLLLIVEMANSE